MDQKRFLKFIEKFGHYFLVNLFYSENLFVPAKIPIFVPEIWGKMFSANQIAGFFN